MAFEYIPGDTILHRLDPRTKLLWFAVTGAFLGTMWFDPIWSGALLLSVLIIAKIGNIPANKIWSIIKTLFPLMIAFMLYNIIWPPKIYQVNPIYQLGPITMYYDAVLFSMATIINFIILVLCMRIILIITPTVDFVLGLTKLKLPVEFGMAISIGFAYVPVLVKELSSILQARKVRGWRPTRNPLKRAWSYLPMFYPIVMRSSVRAQMIANSMESRGFTYNPRERTYLRKIVYTRTDAIICVLLIAFAVFGYAVGRYGMGLAEITFTKV